MDLPKVKNVLTDPKTEIRYVVWAYRKLNQQELVDAVRTGLSLMKKKSRPKKGQQIEFFTIIGHND